jgi:hypothetical protein
MARAVSWKQTPCFGTAVSMKYGQYAGLERIYPCSAVEFVGRPGVDRERVDVRL